MAGTFHTEAHPKLMRLLLRLLLLLCCLPPIQSFAQPASATGSRPERAIAPAQLLAGECA